MTKNSGIPQEGLLKTDIRYYDAYFAVRNLIVSLNSVLKANGDLVPFESDKLFNSLVKSGASAYEARVIVEKVKELPDRISTKMIYRRAFEWLKQKSKGAAGRYRLKRAIFDLGPTGYPFEKFVGRLFAKAGYQTQVGVIVNGDCIQHEIDVIASNDEELLMIECKFHGDASRHCDVRIPLYLHSRFNDVQRGDYKGLPNRKFRGIIVTNTHFTSDAIQYSKCSGLELIAWDFPEKNNLKNRIDASGLHPITCLTQMTRKEKHLLMENDLVTCRDILGHEKQVSELLKERRKLKAVFREAAMICESPLLT